MYAHIQAHSLQSATAVQESTSMAQWQGVNLECRGSEITAGVMYMMLRNYFSCKFRNVYAYFLCRLVCTCIHESDAELTCMCFLWRFNILLCFRLLYVIVLTSNDFDACVCVCVCMWFICIVQCTHTHTHTHTRAHSLTHTHTQPL